MRMVRGMANILTAVLALAPLQAAAQCAMCYTAAAQQSARGKTALDWGILILLIPAIVIFCGVFWVAYHRRDWWVEEEELFEEISS